MELHRGTATLAQNDPAAIVFRLVVDQQQDA
jgi:hypothetical protein